MLPMALLICTFKRYLTRQIHKHSSDDLVNQVAPSDGSNLKIQFQFVLKSDVYTNRDVTVTIVAWETGHMPHMNITRRLHLIAKSR